MKQYLVITILFVGCAVHKPPFQVGQRIYGKMASYNRDSGIIYKYDSGYVDVDYGFSKPDKNGWSTLSDKSFMLLYYDRNGKEVWGIDRAYFRAYDKKYHKYVDSDLKDADRNFDGIQILDTALNRKLSEAIDHFLKADSAIWNNKK